MLGKRKLSFFHVKWREHRKSLYCFHSAIRATKVNAASAFTVHLEGESSFTLRSNNSVVQIQRVPLCVHQIVFSLLQILY